MAGVKQEQVVIERAKITRLKVRIVGTSPLVIHKFSKKAREKMKAAMSTPANQKKSKATREPRDFENDFQEARHVAGDGWDGIPAAGFRSAMVDACRLTGLPMTKAKIGVFIIADGFDADDGTPLVKIDGNAAEKLESLVRNDGGSADIRIRPMYREWAATLTIEFDEAVISAGSVINLLDRAGRQVGICEGRHFSKDSNGQGWGCFMVPEQKE